MSYITEFHDKKVSRIATVSFGLECFYYLRATHLFQNAVFILIQKFTNMTKLSVATLKMLNSFGINNLADSN